MPRGLSLHPSMTIDELKRTAESSYQGFRLLGAGSTREVWEISPTLVAKTCMWNSSENRREIYFWHMLAEDKDRHLFLKPILWASNMAWVVFPRAYESREVECFRKPPFSEASQVFKGYGLDDFHSGNVMWKDKRATRWSIVDYAD